jgi:hypothetical protein
VRLDVVVAQGHPHRDLGTGQQRGEAFDLAAAERSIGRLTLVEIDHVAGDDHGIRADLARQRGQQLAERPIGVAEVVPLLDQRGVVAFQLAQMRVGDVQDRVKDER